MIEPRATLMFAEAAEASAVVARQYTQNADTVSALADRLKSMAPHTIFTCARGSSDHAATFAKYLFETRLGILTASYAPSLSSIYGRSLQHMAGQVFCAISQSGKSPDLIMSAESARAAGAFVIALVNDPSSPLARTADAIIPLHAGKEASVAATKSYIAALAALTHIAAEWSQDEDLLSAHRRLPAILSDAWGCDWSRGADLFRDARSLFVLGRGLTLGVAQEAALKFKETCGIHAEAFSSAEVAHGPMALIEEGFPLLVFPPFDEAAEGLGQPIAQFVERGARIAVAGGGFADTVTLALPKGLHPVTAPIAMAQAFYRLVNAVAVSRGYDPDSPRSLSKVTQTR